MYGGVYGGGDGDGGGDVAVGGGGGVVAAVKSACPVSFTCAVMWPGRDGDHPFASFA